MMMTTGFYQFNRPGKNLRQTSIVAKLVGNFNQIDQEI